MWCLIRWRTDRGREPGLDELTRHAISAWLAETAEPYTVGTRLLGMRRFSRWLATEGKLEVAPTDSTELPAPPEKPAPILTDDEITALLKTCAAPRGRLAASTAPSSWAAETGRAAAAA